MAKASPSEREALLPNPKAGLLEQVREVMRFRHYSLRTEEAYLQWIRRYLKFHRSADRIGPHQGWRHPKPRKRLAAFYAASPHAVVCRKGVEAKVSMFYVYVLHSDSDQGLYIGFSAELRRRLAEHKQGKAFATSFRGPWRLIYYEAYVEETDALGRERYLKSGGGRRFLKSQLRNYLQKHPLRETA